ncbi:MAG: signal peptidase II [Desulfovibrionaceae bacterium]|nr:signal peptidase II [Desulfovibrionaceae bacterium]
MQKKYGLLGICALAVCLLDQLTKWLVASTIAPYSTVPIIDGLFDLVHIYNRGAAFGFLNSPSIEWQFWLFLVATLCAAFAIFSLVRSSTDRLLIVSLGLVLGGAVGNLIDRVRARAVLDFLDFYIGTWHWPAFNVADIGICMGALGAVLALYVHPQELHKEPKQ